MACHYPNPEATALLHQALVAMNFSDEIGQDNAGKSQYGVPYRRQIAFDDSPETLVEMAKVIISRDVADGSKVVWFETPRINGYENNREHTCALVLNYHTLPKDSVNGSPGLASVSVSNGGQ